MVLKEYTLETKKKEREKNVITGVTRNANIMHNLNYESSIYEQVKIGYEHD